MNRFTARTAPPVIQTTPPPEPSPQAPAPEPALAPDADAASIVPAALSRPPAEPAEPREKQPADAAFFRDDGLLDARLKLHARLIDEIDLSKLDKLDEKEMRRQVRKLVGDFAREERLPLNGAELEQLGANVFDEMVGLGPIEPLLQDNSIADILINGPFKVYVERHGELEVTPVRFRDNDHLLRIVNRIVSAVGRRIDESSPMVDARLPDGSRVNAAIAPIAIDGACVSIRKFTKKPYDLQRLVTVGAMPACVAEFLHGAIKSRVSTVISGGTGSGKTTLLNALSGAIDHKERLITIEDAAELQLQQPHVVRMETRPPNIEGKGEIRQRELVKNALRMRPDRVILGEVPRRGSLRHAAGHEHRPRRLDGHHPRQRARATPSPAWSRWSPWAAWRSRPTPSAARSPRPSA